LLPSLVIAKTHNPSVKTFGFATSPCTGEALRWQITTPSGSGNRSRSPSDTILSKVRKVYAIPPVFYTFSNARATRMIPRAAHWFFCSRSRKKATPARVTTRMVATL